MSFGGVLAAGGLFGAGTPLVIAAAVGAAPIAVGFLAGAAVCVGVNYMFTGSWKPDWM